MNLNPQIKNLNAILLLLSLPVLAGAITILPQVEIDVILSQVEIDVDNFFISREN